MNKFRVLFVAACLLIAGLFYVGHQLGVSNDLARQQIAQLEQENIQLNIAIDKLNDSAAAVRSIYSLEYGNYRVVRLVDPEGGIALVERLAPLGYVPAVYVRELPKHLRHPDATFSYPL